MQQFDYEKLATQLKLLYVVLSYKELIKNNALNYARFQDTDNLCKEDKFFYELNEIMVKLDEQNQ